MIENPPPGRAWTPAMKAEMLNTLLRAWLRSPELRLGQLICNAAPVNLFYIEDTALIHNVEQSTFIDHDLTKARSLIHHE